MELLSTVSVVIPCYNAQHYIRDAINSVRNQDIPECEIIVIDDGSTDASADIIENEFDYVQLIRTKQKGASAARNLGTRKSKGEFIQYLDADDLLAPQKLKTQLSVLRDSEADVAYGDWQILSRSTDGAFMPGKVIRRRIMNPEIDLFTDFWCPPAVYLYRRSIVDKIGGWNEQLPIIQDARFALDGALHGGRFIYCPGIMAYYRKSAANTLSTSNPVKFLSDVYNNAGNVESWWKRNGGINAERRKALLKVYEYIARASYNHNKELFEKAYNALETWSPGFIPSGPRPLVILSRLFGYRNAERIAGFYRGVKTLINKVKTR